MIQNVVVLGGGSAGLIAALTLKRKLPQLNVRVIRSVEIGVIGVGEGTTAAFPRHFFDYLKLEPRDFYFGAEPTWKLGIRFLWGPRPAFYYTFAREYEHRWPELRRNVGFYHDDETKWIGHISANMAHGKVFSRKPDGSPSFHKNHAFHVENVKLVAHLETTCRVLGVEVTDGTMTRAELGPVNLSGKEEHGVTALVLESGERVTADLFVDASGFRSELLIRALGEPVIDYSASLFCDRAVIAGWTRTDEPTLPFTTAETMNSGWAWQIEHQDWINRGYVYSSRFCDDDSARAELLAKNPRLAARVQETGTEPRLVKFRSYRTRRLWVGNVVGVGNASGFVEPLEATALQVIVIQVSTLADGLIDSLQEPTPTMISFFNQYNGQQWDDIRDFLAAHYRFNTRLDSPFWRAAQHETDLAGAQPVIDFYRENGPSSLLTGLLLPPANSFGLEGYFALLVGQQVPHGKPYSAPPQELEAWRKRCASYGEAARNALTVPEALAALKQVWTRASP